MLVVIALDKMNPLLLALLLSILLDNEKQCDEGMKEVYKNQKSNQDEFLKRIALLYAYDAIDGILKPTYKECRTITKEMQGKLKHMASEMAKNEVNSLEKTLNERYAESYYKNGYVFGLGSKINIKKLDEDVIANAVNTKMVGQIYSDRIWKNKSAMVNKLNLELQEALNSKRTVDQIAKNIKKEFKVQAYESKRLARTEMVRVQTEATTQFARDNGIKQQLFDATLDNKTSEKCRGYDGTYWDVNDPSKPTPPLHPNCRSCLINIPNSRWKPSKKWDNESKQTIDYKDYNTWLKENNIAD